MFLENEDSFGARRRYFFSVAFLTFGFGALLVLRVTPPIVSFLTIPKAWALGLYLGLLFDLAAVLAVIGVAGLVGACGSIVGASLLFAYWLALVSNRLYYDYFHDVLGPQVAASHAADLTKVWDVVIQMLLRPEFLGSGALLLVALAALPKLREASKPRRRRRAALALGGTLLAVAAALLLGRRVSGPDLFSWELTRLLRRPSGETTGAAERFSCRSNEEPTDQGELLPRVPSGEPGAERRKITAELGLDPARPIPVVLLMVESLRAFELFHPTWSEVIFPMTSKLVKTNAIAFTQAYTQVYEFGQSARGLFSTLCSHLPNFHDEAVHIAYPELRATCLAEVMRGAGYHSSWYFGDDLLFHGNGHFMRNHGMDEVNGQDYFTAQGFGRKEKVTSWGYADQPVLKASWSRIEALAREHTVFASLLTLTSHPPFLEEMARRLPDSFYSREKITDETYRGFAGTLNYTDEAIGRMVESFLSSPRFENGLFVLTADHSTWPLPHPLPELANFDIHFRIPIVLFTQHLPHPRRIDRVANQMDIAPTIAAVAGAAPDGRWMGKTLFHDESPSPWLISWKRKPVYRRGDRYCIRLAEDGDELKCHDLAGRDPLFSSGDGIRALTEDKEETERLCQTLRSNAAELRRNGKTVAPRVSTGPRPPSTQN